jgi:hypothetical protein
MISLNVPKIGFDFKSLLMIEIDELFYCEAFNNVQVGNIHEMLKSSHKLKTIIDHPISKHHQKAF